MNNEESRCSFSHFQEVDEAQSLLNKLTRTCLLPIPSVSRDENPTLWNNLCDVLNQEEKSLSRWMTLVKPYADQPKLLDQHLEKMVQTLLNKLISLLKMHFKRKRQNETHKEDKGESNFRVMVAKDKNVLDFNQCIFPEDFTFYVESLRFIQDVHLTCSILHTLCMVCGGQRVCQYFPTDIPFFELILSSLEWIVAPHIFAEPLVEYHQKTLLSLFKPSSLVDPRGATHFGDTTWKLTFLLLWWMALLILVPFDLKTFGSRPRQYASSSSPEAVMVFTRVFFVIQECLKHPTVAIQKATAVLTSNFFSRSDISKGDFPRIFLNLCEEQLTKRDYGREPSGSSDASLGYFVTLKRVLKQCAECFEDTGFHAFADVVKKTRQQWGDSRQPLRQRKCYLSIVALSTQRMLPKQRRSWCYRSERTMLFGHSVRNIQEAVTDEVQLSKDVLTCCEETLNFVFEMLEDRALVVRWAAAKRLGSLVSCLPEDLGHQAVEYVVGLLKQSESGGDQKVLEQQNCIRHEAACSGALLALAELVRQRCILVHHLNPIVKSLCYMVTYEPLLTNRRQDVAIRDAACYVCWALVRCFSGHASTFDVGELNNALICAALFDGDVNCRRAASAALQESIGRHGCFPDGVALLSLIHYYSVSTRRSSYLHVAPKVAQLEGYNVLLLNFLVERKLICLDYSVRVLASQCVFRLGPFCPLVVILAWVDKLEKKISSTLDAPCVPLRHGSFLGLCGLLFSLSVRQKDQNARVFSLHSKLALRLRNLVPRLEKSRGYRGRGGDVIREAVCFYIMLLSSDPDLILFKETLTTQRYLPTLLQCLRHFSLAVQISSVEALYVLAHRRCSMKEAQDVVKSLVDELKQASLTVASRRGYLLGVGTVACCCVDHPQVLDFCLKTLCLELVEMGEERDASSRCGALVSLGLVVEALVESVVKREKNQERREISVWEKIPWEMVKRTLMICGVDYQVDSRGDVGSWVREVTLELVVLVLEVFLLHWNGLKRCCVSLRKRAACWVIDLVNSLFRTMTDQLNRLRSRAVYLLYRFLINLVYVKFFFGPEERDCFLKKNQLPFPHLSGRLIYRRVYNSFCYEVLSGEEQKKIENLISSQLSPFVLTADKALDEFLPYTSFLYWFVLHISEGCKAKEDPPKPPFEATKNQGFSPGDQVEPTTTDQDDLSNEPEKDVTFGPKGMDSLGLFLKPALYDYVEHHSSEKSAVVIKLEKFTQHRLIFQTILPALLAEPYATALLEGLTHSLGVSMGEDRELLVEDLEYFLNGPDRVPCCAYLASASAKVRGREKEPVTQWIVKTLVAALLTRFQYKKNDPTVAAKDVETTEPVPPLFTPSEHEENTSTTTCPSTAPQTWSEGPYGPWDDVATPAISQLPPFHFTPLSHLLCTLHSVLDIKAAQEHLCEAQTLLPFCWRLMIHSRNLKCLRACVGLCCLGVTTGGGLPEKIKKGCLRACLLMLIHAYPILREFSCKTLYSSLIRTPANRLEEWLHLTPPKYELFLETLASVRWWYASDMSYTSHAWAQDSPGVTWKQFQQRYASLDSLGVDETTRQIYQTFHQLIGWVNLDSSFSGPES